MSEKIKKEERFITKIPAHILEEATKFAVKKAHALNNPIPILEGNKIVIKNGKIIKELLLIKKEERIFKKQKMSLVK